jgi:protein involved in polysaccharide export with SLBB domain
MSIRISTAILLVLLVLAGVPRALAAQEAGQPVPAQPIATAQSEALMSSVTLLPGDLIRVQVYREKELDGEYLVDEAGTVVLPLLGEQRVVGMSMRELRRQLVEAYQVHLRNPSIIITPLRRINVLGEVQRPGMYAIDPTVSVAGAVAMAGGATAAGDLRKVRIIRDGRVYAQRLGPGTVLSAADVRSGDQIFVERRSWFDRNSTFVVSTTLSLTSIIIAILRR